MDSVDQLVFRIHLVGLSRIDGFSDLAGLSKDFEDCFGNLKVFQEILSVVLMIGALSGVLLVVLRICSLF